MIRLSKRFVREVTVTLALLGGPAVIASGCGDKSLEKLQAPSEGVALSYDLGAGATYSGHVRRGETVQTQLGGLNRSVEYDIRLHVLGEDPNRGDTLVSATFTNVKVDWNLGPNAPPNVNLNEFIAQAQKNIQGMEVRFNVGPNGKINYMPPPPQEGVSDELKLVIEGVLDSVETAFLTLPGKAIKVGDSWEDKEKHGRKGKLGRFREGTSKTTFEGLYRDARRQEDVAKLVIEKAEQEVITTKAGSHENQVNGKTVALFSTTGSYLAKIEGETRKFDPTTGTTFTKVMVEWRKDATGGKGAAAAPETQTITDPCNPDYVGAEECQAITDPCHPDYVGAEECSEEAADN